MIRGSLVFTILWLIACTSVQHISKTQVDYTVVGSQASTDDQEDIQQLIAPYKAQLDSSMHEVIAHVSNELTKRKPESTMGNWFADALITMTHQYGYEADLAVSNYGGLRVPQITEGPLTVGEMYELSPFENTLVILELEGHELDSLLLRIAENEGWPVSKELRMVIQDKKVVSRTVNGFAVEANKIYKVATNDYVANGGDGMKLLIEQPRIQTGILVRDLLIEHARNTGKLGQPVSARIDGRIVIQN